MGELLGSASFWYGVGVMTAAGLVVFGGKGLIHRILGREEAERTMNHDSNHTKN